MENDDSNLDFRKWFMQNQPLLYLNKSYTSRVDDENKV